MIGIHSANEFKICVSVCFTFTDQIHESKSNFTISLISNSHQNNDFDPNAKTNITLTKMQLARTGTKPEPRVLNRFWP